jgi:hypothetical protein
VQASIPGRKRKRKRKEFGEGGTDHIVPEDPIEVGEVFPDR